MGWAGGDPVVKAEALVLAAKARQAAYPLIQKLQEITHPEKGPRLVKLANELYAKLDEISYQLSR